MWGLFAFSSLFFSLKKQQRSFHCSLPFDLNCLGKKEKQMISL